MPTWVAPWYDPLPPAMPTVTYADTPDGRKFSSAGVGTFDSLQELVEAWSVGQSGVADVIVSQGSYVISSPDDPGLTTEGLWIQTGLGPGGDDFTIWFEDGS